MQNILQEPRRPRAFISLVRGTYKNSLLCRGQRWARRGPGRVGAVTRSKPGSATRTPPVALPPGPAELRLPEAPTVSELRVLPKETLLNTETASPCKTQKCSASVTPQPRARPASGRGPRPWQSRGVASPQPGCWCEQSPSLRGDSFRHGAKGVPGACCCFLASRGTLTARPRGCGPEPRAAAGAAGGSLRGLRAPGPSISCFIPPARALARLSF